MPNNIATSEDFYDIDLPTITIPKNDASMVLYQICKEYSELAHKNPQERIDTYKHLSNGCTWLTKRFNSFVKANEETHDS